MLESGSTTATGEMNKTFQFVGGALCLDFCNTMGGKRGGIVREKLHSYVDFLGWCEQAGLITESQREVLERRSVADPIQSGSVYERALELREGIYRIMLAAAIEGAAPSGKDLGLLNAELARSLGRMRIKRDQNGTAFGWGWADELAGLDEPLGSIAHSAAQVLASPKELAHVRQCRADNCGWVFIDSSKNHSRCWCDMRDCGNRAKVRRHRQKHQL